MLSNLDNPLTPGDSRMSTSNPPITLAKGAASATLIGVIAVFLWACLALLTTLTAGIPAFQLLASSFAVAFVASLCVLGLRGAAGFSSWRQPWPGVGNRFCRDLCLSRVVFLCPEGRACG